MSTVHAGLLLCGVVAQWLVALSCRVELLKQLECAYECGFIATLVCSPAHLHGVVSNISAQKNHQQRVSAFLRSFQRMYCYHNEHTDGKFTIDAPSASDLSAMQFLKVLITNDKQEIVSEI